jgi:DNA-binding NtrC family response regulator
MPDSIHVLLVDDEKIFVESLTKVLRKRGMEVLAAHNGLAALEILTTAKVDVIVLDLRMPGMDGLATLEEIRIRDPLMPVILLTGHMDISRVTQVMHKGATEVLLKPCPAETLVSAIENACELKDITREVADTQSDQ